MYEAFWIAVSVMLVFAAMAIAVMVLVMRLHQEEETDDQSGENWYVELWNIRQGYQVEFQFANTCILGRLSLFENASVPVQMDPTISREHCMLYEQDGALLVWNMSEVNPAAINGHRLNQPMQLICGDRIELGNSVYLVTRVERM